MTRETFTDDLVRWIRRRLAPPGAVVDADTELFADGLIDSIRILQLIAWTERAIGHPIPDEQIRMDSFRTARRIAETFAGPAGDPDLVSGRAGERRAGRA